MRQRLHRFEERVAAVGLPSRPICAALVFVFLAFGTVIGRVTRPQVADARDQHPLLELSSPSSSSGGSKPPAIAESTSTPKEKEEEETESAGESEAKSSSESNGKSKTSDGKGSGKSGAGSKQGARKAIAKLPAIKHVFLIVLDDAAYAEVFGPQSKSHYLASTLEGKGELLERFYAISHQQLPNGIALISGEGPTEATVQDCPKYAEITPAGSAAAGQVTGEGCVYPSSVQTLASQLSEKHLTWKAYVQGIGNGGSEVSSACYHPQLGAEDPTSPFGLPGAAPPVGGIVSATFRDPFVYFRSVTGSSSCGKDVVGTQRLRHDLASASDTPSFSYIVPDLCEDGSTKPCAPGKPDGMAAANGFLSKVVPEVLASKAYKRSGLLAITVDEAPSTGEYADSSSCCGQPSFPNVHASGSKGAGSGGGEVGALLLSPFVKGGKISQETYNDFSLLRTIEDIFGVSHLGYADASGVSSLAPSLFTK